MKAIQIENFKMEKYLVENGVDINIINNNKMVYLLL